MPSKLDAIHPVCLHAVEDAKGRIQVLLNEGLIHRRHLVPWLHHRVIDLLDEYQLLDYFDEDLDDRLGLLCADITSDYVGALFEEGEEAVKRQGEEAKDDDPSATLRFAKNGAPAGREEAKDDAGSEETGRGSETDV